MCTLCPEATWVSLRGGIGLETPPCVTPHHFSSSPCWMVWDLYFSLKKAWKILGQVLWGRS